MYNIVGINDNNKGDYYVKKKNRTRINQLEKHKKP